jgi:hypothetical protein
MLFKSYLHIVDSRRLEVQSGYVDYGETPAQASRRQLMEKPATPRKGW